MRGFAGYRRPETITDERLEKEIERLNVEGRFIYWTGEPYNRRRESLRSNSLFALKEAKVPVPLADWIRLAARVVGPEVGYDPRSVRAGLYLHHDSKPAVFFELKRDAAGNYVSVNSIPNISKPIKAGDIIIPAEAAEAPAKVEVRGGTDIVETPESKAKRTATRAARAKGKPAPKRAPGRA